MKDRYLMTKKQYKEIARRINEVEDKLAIIGEKIGIAAEWGDYRENAEFLAAKEEQHLLKVRLRDLSEVANNSEVITYPTEDPDTVCVGSTVIVRNYATMHEESFHIVGHGEHDIEKGEMQYVAPRAEQFMGKRRRELVEVKIGGKIVGVYGILDIKPYVEEGKEDGEQEDEEEPEKENAPKRMLEFHFLVEDKPKIEKLFSQLENMTKYEERSDRFRSLTFISNAVRRYALAEGEDVKIFSMDTGEVIPHNNLLEELVRKEIIVVCDSPTYNKLNEKVSKEVMGITMCSRPKWD
jgi:transcription elongation factor GreA